MPLMAQMFDNYIMVVMLWQEGTQLKAKLKS